MAHLRPHRGARPHLRRSVAPALPRGAAATLAARRVLILSADVGEGHLAAARALAEDLRRLGGIEVVESDGLAALGRAATQVIRDGYRFQLRWLPWTYAAMYWLGTHVPPLRTIGAWALGMVGHRRMRRLVRDAEPDVVVSTHPAVTCVLARDRQRGRLDVPLHVTVTDLADYTFWAHPGADLHMVAHLSAVAQVERVAGKGSAVVTRPLVHPRFRVALERDAARRALGLAPDARIVAVSGGGWGVGDLGGAIDAALEEGAEHVIALPGRAIDVAAALRARFAGEPRVEVWDFTDRMPELLRAVDVLVHSTGGVTSLEALSCGCPLVAYGSTLGHIDVHNRSMAAVGLITHAPTLSELRAALAARLAPGADRPAPLGDGASPAALVASAVARTHPARGRSRVVAGRLSRALAAGTLAVGVLGTDGAFSIASRPLDIDPLTHLATNRPVVGLVVRVPTSDIRRAARRLDAAGMHASLAVVREPAARDRRVVAGLGDDVLPELGSHGRVRWLQTRTELREAARTGAPRSYLVPPSGISLGEYLLARTTGARPVEGRNDVTVPGGTVPSGVRAGDVLVVTVDQVGAMSASSLRGVRTALTARGLSPVPLSTLLSGSTSERRTGDRSNSTALPTTTVRASSTPGTPSGV
jgi:UDP-N-acetylglucosamine:LPS N-acetylglucosamine transferase